MSRLRSTLALIVMSVMIAPMVAAQRCSSQGVVQLRELLAPGDPLAVHKLAFDASLAVGAIDYERSNNAESFAHMAKSAALQHILNHARNFDYDIPKSSPEALLTSLLDPKGKQAGRAAACEQSVRYFCGAMLQDPHWVAETLRYLPPDFRFDGSLFLTFGYDIGVAFAPNASLNCTHRHFESQPSELLYYAIHELHHVGFMSYHKPPRVGDMKTCADLLKLVEYSTQLEGMAVLAAYERRRADHALADDPDYVALEDAKRMEDELAAYRKDYDYLKSRGTQPVDGAAWAVITRMSSGERLWYRVGALMAQRIEAANGRTALVGLVRQGPEKFRAAFEAVK